MTMYAEGSTMTQLSAKRPWRIIFACLILISGAAMMIATSPHFIKSGLQKYQTAFYTKLDVADKYEKAKAGVCATDSHC
jgi:hypothetical protein